MRREIRQPIHRQGKTPSMRLGVVLLCLILLLLPLGAAAKELVSVTVSDAFIDMHTGPGRGYPVFHIVKRHEQVQIVKNKTDWFLVRTLDREPLEGWVYRAEMLRTFTDPTVKQRFGNLAFKDFSDRDWEFGVLGGSFEKSAAVTLYVAWNFNANLNLSANLLSTNNVVSDYRIYFFSLESTPFPKWTVSPYFALGAGIMRTTPTRSAIVNVRRTDNVVSAGLGFRYYMTRRVLLNTQVVQYLAFIDNDTTGEFLEWKGGVSIFY